MATPILNADTGVLIPTTQHILSSQPPPLTMPALPARSPLRDWKKMQQVCGYLKPSSSYSSFSPLSFPLCLIPNRLLILHGKRDKSPPPPP